MNAIETDYKGYKFRSRLEAKWAAFFDLLGWQWEYEPFDLNGYIPDFVLKFHKPLLVEVKPALSHQELCQYLPKIEASGWERDAMIVGATLLESEYEIHPSIGLISQRNEDGFGWDEACLHKCTNCNSPSIHHATGSYRCYKSGCYEGDHFLGQFNTDEAKHLFATSSTLTRWTPK